MNQNDIALKKTALCVGVALLIFLALFYGAFAVLEFIISPIVYKILGNTLGGVISKLLTGVVYAAVFILPALIFKRINPSEHKKSGLAPAFPLDLAPFIIMATVALSISCSYVNSWLGTAIGASSSTPSTEITTPLDFILLTFTTAIVPAVCEEFLFRKTIENALLPYSESFAIISSALMFGLMHQNVWQIFYATMAGIVLGYIYARTRSYLCVFLIHFTNNFISVIQTAMLGNLREPYVTIAISTLMAAVILLGAISAIILILKEKNKKDAYSTGSFGKILFPSEGFVQNKTSRAPSKIFFLSPSVLIFIIISVLICASQLL